MLPCDLKNKTFNLYKNSPNRNKNFYFSNYLLICLIVNPIVNCLIKNLNLFYNANTLKFIISHNI